MHSLDNLGNDDFSLANMYIRTCITRMQEDISRVNAVLIIYAIEY